MLFRSRFCWFSFDDVVDAYWSYTWSEVKPRVGLRDMSADIVVRESGGHREVC